jgi:hypothetical protein
MSNSTTTQISVSQEPFETNTNYSFRLTIIDLISNEFPTLSPSSILVLSSAIISKLFTGQIFNYDIEQLIDLVFPVISKKL